MFNKQHRRREGGRREEKKEFDQNILDLARVTRVTEGGKHLSFRACVVLGDRAGRVGLGLAKGKDVQLAVEKAVRQAKKKLIRVPLVKNTIPHPVLLKFKAAKIMLKPAPEGSGIIAGGAVRAILDLAGVPNVSSKILGKTKNKIALAKATMAALCSFKTKPVIEGKPAVEEIDEKVIVVPPEVIASLKIGDEDDDLKSQIKIESI